MVSDIKISEEETNKQVEHPAGLLPAELYNGLLQKYGMTLYEVFWLEDGINDTQILALLHQVLDHSLEQINSPSLLTPKVSLFFAAQRVIKDLKKSRGDVSQYKNTDPVLSNPFIHTLKQLSSEKRFIYLLRIKGNFSYHDLETIMIRHRDEISLSLTEAREFLRISLAKEPSIPFLQEEELCPAVYKYLSPYLDNELNALNILDIEKHLLNCDKCLQLLANHQYIQKQINNIHIISEEEFLSYFQAENAIRTKQKITKQLENSQKHIRKNNRFQLFSLLWNFIRRK